MSEYREGCIKHKQVRSGEIEQRSVLGHKKKRVDGPWLAVHWHNNSNRWNVWHGYKHEQDARKIMNKMISYWQMYVVHVDVFDAFYRR